MKQSSRTNGRMMVFQYLVGRMIQTTCNCQQQLDNLPTSKSPESCQINIIPRLKAKSPVVDNGACVRAAITVFALLVPLLLVFLVLLVLLVLLLVLTQGPKSCQHGHGSLNDVRPFSSACHHHPCPSCTCPTTRCTLAWACPEACPRPCPCPAWHVSSTRVVATAEGHRHRRRGTRQSK